MSLYERCGTAYQGSDDAILQCIANTYEAESAKDMEDLLHWFLTIAASLVFFMQAGFAMVCAGSVREKNLQNTMLKNLLDACSGALTFYCIGYGLAYGGQEESTSKTFVGTKAFFGTGDISPSFWFFQYACSATTVTIVAGTLAERCRMSAYLVYSVYLTGFVLPVVFHALWSHRGILSANATEPFRGIGALDFAGSGAIHMTGGMTALIATCILGPRKGRFFHTKTGEALTTPKAFPGHSKALQLLGTMVLWFGCTYKENIVSNDYSFNLTETFASNFFNNLTGYGFNPGSALLRGVNFNVGRIAATAALNTSLAGPGGAIGALLAALYFEKRKRGERAYNLVAAMNGLLSGLVAINAGCGTVEPWAAALIGLIGGWLYLGSSALLIRWKIDDVVDAVPVHLVPGVWGMLAAGLFTEPNHLQEAFHTTKHVGMFYSWESTLLMNQTICVIFILGWTIITMGPFFLLLRYVGWLRASDMEEVIGLDQIDMGCTYNEGGDEGYVIRRLPNIRNLLKTDGTQ